MTAGREEEPVRVLVLDDEPEIREVIARTLGRNGYDCTGAGDIAAARDALAGAREAGNPFDVVVCDVELPDGSGAELAAELRRSSPDVAVVMATGHDDPAVADELFEHGIFGYVVKPFTPNEILINVAHALRRQRLTSRTQAEARALEGRLATATDEIERIRQQHERAVQESMTDPKTGVWNYRYLQLKLAEECRRWGRYGSRFGLLVIDLDRFKEVNDTHGHPAGDAVLAELVRRLEVLLRTQLDVVARYGGDEFVVLLPETDLAGARVVAGRILASVLEAGFPPSGLAVSVSIGVAACPEHGDMPTALFTAADEALYGVKQAGGAGVGVAAG